MSVLLCKCGGFRWVLSEENGKKIMRCIEFIGDKPCGNSVPIFLMIHPKSDKTVEWKNE